MNSEIREKVAEAIERAYRHGYERGSIDRESKDDNLDADFRAGNYMQMLHLKSREPLALLGEQQEPVGWVTPQDLERIRGLEPSVPSVNVWAEPDDGDVPLYLAPQQYRDREASVIHKAIQILAQMPKKEWDAWGRSTAQRLDRYEQVLATQEADDG